MPVVAQRQNPVVLAAAATSIQLKRDLYSVVVPAFGLILVVLALKKGFTSGKHSRSAYAFIASLAVLSGLAGSLGSHAQAESVIQALLSLFLCIPVLHLTSVHNTSALSLSRCQFISRTFLKGLLIISLSSAALLTVLNGFITYKLAVVVHLSFPATLFLAYTIFAICLLLSQISLEFCQARPAILSGRKPRPITINIDVATQSPAVPINLVRSSGVSATDPCEHQGVQELDKFANQLADHHKRPSVDSDISITSTFNPTTCIGSAHLSDTNTPDFGPLTIRTRIQGFLPLLFLLLAQFALCASYSCKLVIDFKPLSAHVLEITLTSLSVVGVMATMKAYFLHAYNAHLGSLGLSVPNSRSSTGYSNRSTPNLVGEEATPFGHTVTPPIPSKSLTSPSSRSPGHRLRVPRFNPSIRASHQPRSTISDHDRSSLQMTDSDEKGRDAENGRLVNSFSVGSLKSVYGTSGSDESDQTRVEGSVQSNTRKVMDLKGVHSRASACQRAESSEAYIQKRGTIPVPPEKPAPKRLLGFGWLNGIANRYRGEKEFVEGEQRYKTKSSPSSSVLLLPPGTPPVARARGRESRKSKRNTVSTAPATPTSYTASAFTCTDWNSDSTLCRMSSDLETDMSMGNIVPTTLVRSSTRRMARKRSCEYASSIYGIHECPKRRTCEVDEENKNGSLRLKRSFKLDDGRTLSPQLMLAAAISGEICTIEAESSFGSRWEKVVESGELDHNETVRNSQIKGAMTAEIEAESEGRWEARNPPPSLSETRPHLGPEKSREGSNIRNLPNIAQCPLEVNTGFTPATSEPIIPAAYPSMPSEPASCSSNATVSPLVPDRTPMILRSSASDHGHGRRSLEPLQLARISSSPSSRTQPVLSREHNVKTPTTPTRGRSTFSSSSSSKSLRLSAVTIEGVRNALSGIWSGKSGKPGVQHSPVPSASRESISKMSHFSGATEKDDNDDFMDLRDPFASPGVRKVRRIPSSGCAGVTSVDLSEDGYAEPCEDPFATPGGFGKMNPCRRFPVTSIRKGHSSSFSGQSDSSATYLLTGTENTSYFSRVGDVLPAKPNEHRKEKRPKKRIQRRPKIPIPKLPVLDDMIDFDVEEALLTQKLLKRLDDDHRGPGVRF